MWLIIINKSLKKQWMCDKKICFLKLRLRVAIAFIAKLSQAIAQAEAVVCLVLFLVYLANYHA